MAYRRSLSIRAALLPRRFNPSFSYISSRDNDRNKLEDFYSLSRSNFETLLTQRRFFGSCLNRTSPWQFTGAFCRTGCGLVENVLPLNRHMSTSVGEADTNRFVAYADLAATAINDSIAAADAAFPVAALQYLINGVHSFTGLNWWGSIALATLFVRGVTIPFQISLLKATSKLTLMRPQLEEIQKQMLAQAREPQAVAEGKQKIKDLFNENGVTPSTPYKEIFIQTPIIIIFYITIANMTMKVPSFKTGGALWFTDLTTPDDMYIFPVMTALTFLAPMEYKMQESHVDAITKIDTRVLALVSLPLTVILPKAILCYWVTSNLFSLCYEFIIKIPRVKKALGIPEIHLNLKKQVKQRKKIKKR